MMNAILKVERLFKAFEGVSVIHDVSFTIAERELSAIIGPNGAGKTTLFNLITGYHRADSGKVYFRDRDVAGMQPYEIVKLGIARAFQVTNIFPRLTVQENVLAAVLSHQKRTLNMLRPSGKMEKALNRTDELLRSVGLSGMAHQQSGTLAHGNQKRLDIAVALALEPVMLLLDEPTAGMSPDERRETVELVQQLWDRLNITMVFIEHDMDIVFGISQIVRVLCYGQMLAEGTPEEISRNEQVIEAYLGEEI